MQYVSQLSVHDAQCSPGRGPSPPACMHAASAAAHEHVSGATAHPCTHDQEIICCPRLEAEAEALMEQRCSAFVVAVKAVNERLSPIFCHLSGLRGDAYCSHATDRGLLFAQGVTFHVRCVAFPVWAPHPCPITCQSKQRSIRHSEVPCMQRRPDAKCWRPFGALSGGQQALASLALTFALQVRPVASNSFNDCNLPGPFHAPDIASHDALAPVAQANCMHIDVAHRCTLTGKCRGLMAPCILCGCPQHALIACRRRIPHPSTSSTSWTPRWTPATPRVWRPTSERRSAGSTLSSHTSRRHAWHAAGSCVHITQLSLSQTAHAHIPLLRYHPYCICAAVCSGYADHKALWCALINS